jgi:hypothetical protein
MLSPQATMQRPPTSGIGVGAVHATSPSTAMRHVAPRSLSVSVRPTLPDRNVGAATIEDAYVRFILYCNPAVPLDTDTTALREAFQNPPKSGGKSFNTFTLFTLLRQLVETKEIKTWAKLAVKLGVEPPADGQSSQKIQQYAVRLKVRTSHDFPSFSSPGSRNHGTNFFCSAVDALHACRCLF